VPNNAECGMRNAELMECGMRNAECGMERATVERDCRLLRSNPALQFRIPHSAFRIGVGRGEVLRCG